LYITADNVKRWNKLLLDCLPVEIYVKISNISTNTLLSAVVSWA